MGELPLAEDLINQGFTALLLSPQTGANLIPAVEAAAKAGNPVLNVSDAVIEGQPGGYAAGRRTAGFTETINASGKFTVVASVRANRSREEAFNTATTILQKYLDLIGFYANNDGMALGVVEAVKAAGRADTVAVLGPDGVSDADAAIDVTAPIRDLRVTQRQIVEIAMALRSNARVIAMDEPISSLTPTEFDRLVEVIRGLAARGVAIIHVSHKMDEVVRLCQSTTILRDGRLVTQVPIPATGVSQVIELMVGRELAHVVHRSFVTDRVLLKVAGLTRGKAGLGLVPEERKRDGIIWHQPVTSNIGLPAMQSFSRFGMIRNAKLEARSEALMQEVRLRRFDVSKPIGSFSGGNPQKAIIGRGLVADTKIFLFDEPTRGIGVGAKAEICGLGEKLARDGKAVVVVSSELLEVIRVSDRVLVMREGRIAADLGPTGITETNIARNAVPAS